MCASGRAVRKLITRAALFLSAPVSSRVRRPGMRKSPEKKECGSFIVKDGVRSFVPGRRDDMDDPVANVQMRRAFRPMIKTKESKHPIEVRSNNLNIRDRSKLHIPGVMIAMSMRVNNQERQAHTIFGWQERKDSLRQRHFAWIRHRTAVYQ